jgi:hypothetical protein
MKNRVLNPASPNYHRYGGRGITICSRWLRSFIAFYEDMGDPPEGMSLERVNNDGAYSLENCHWATMKEQGQNTAANRVIEMDGESMTLTSWAARIGVHYSVLAYRLQRWSLRDALTIPPGTKSVNSRMLTLNGETLRMSDWAKRTGIKKNTIWYRVRSGWSTEDALTKRTR